MRSVWPEIPQSIIPATSVWPEIPRLIIPEAYGHPRARDEGAELLAADLFKNADQTRQRITFGDVVRYLAQLASHPPDCTCGRCALVPRVSAQRVYAIASGWQRQVRATRVRAMR